MNFLYRGVSLDIHLESGGKLIPKGLSFRHPVKYGSRIAKYGLGITYGSSGRLKGRLLRGILMKEISFVMNVIRKSSEKIKTLFRT